MANRNRARARAIRVHQFKTGMSYIEAARELDENPVQPHAEIDRHPRCWPIGSCQGDPDNDSDAASCRCVRCGNWVCVVCYRTPARTVLSICYPCVEDVTYDFLPFGDSSDGGDAAGRETSHRTGKDHH